MFQPEAYDSFAMRLAVRAHFTTVKYDYIKYSGGWKDLKNSWEKRTDKSFYHVLAGRYKKKLRDFYVSVYCREGTEDVWVGDLLGEEYQKGYTAWRKRNEALRQTFKTDLATIKDFMEESDMSFTDTLVSHNGRLPPVIQLERLHISPETLVILHLLTGMLNKECIHPVWPDTQLRLTKYRSFVRLPLLSHQVYAKIAKEQLCGQLV